MKVEISDRYPGRIGLTLTIDDPSERDEIVKIIESRIACAYGGGAGAVNSVFVLCLPGEEK